MYLSGGCLDDNVRWLHAELLNFYIGIARQRGRTTAQGRVQSAKCFANSAVARLDILTVDMNGWRLVYGRIKFKIFLQGRRWGFGCWLADPNLRIALAEFILIGVHAD